MGLIQCPDCSGKLSTEATACPHCGRPTKKSSSRSRYLTVLVILGALFLFALFTAPDSTQTSPRSSSAPAPAEPLPQLSIGAWKWRYEDGYAIAEGQVSSVSSHALEDVEAVVTFTTKDGHFITSQSAPVDYNPILPGQTSSWRVMATWNPAIANASLQFKTVFGTTLRAERRQ